MGKEGQFPEELGGKRDFDHITPKGRRLTEYEAVTCYTQPQAGGGGLQMSGDFQLRPEGRPVFDLAGTSLACDDWFAYRDPSQMWQRPYYVTQSEAEKSIERATEVVLKTGAACLIEARWVDAGLIGAYFPFGHYEYGLFRALNCAAREALSDTINNALAFNAADKLRHAQAISILGLDLERALPGFDGTRGKAIWLEDAAWQPLRRLVEDVMATADWCEASIAVDGVIEPLIGEPLRRLVFGSAAARNRDQLVPLIAGTATSDWHRTASAVQELLRFLVNCPGADGNRPIMTSWLAAWREKTIPVADGLFAHLEAQLDESGLHEAAKAAGEEETRRAGVHQLDEVSGLV